MKEIFVSTCDFPFFSRYPELHRENGMTPKITQYGFNCPLNNLKEKDDVIIFHT